MSTWVSWLSMLIEILLIVYRRVGVLRGMSTVRSESATFVLVVR